VLTANHVSATTLRAGAELKMPVLEIRKDAGTGPGDWGAAVGKGSEGKRDAKTAVAHPGPKAGPAAGTPKDTSTKAKTVTAGLSGRTYTVKRGDTLSEIAMTQVGSMRFVDQIVAMNKDKLVDPKLIRPGMVLRLPAAGSAETARAAGGKSAPAKSAPTRTSSTTAVAAAMREFKID
jgi:nucleoid-associated protein YgaU